MGHPGIKDTILEFFYTGNDCLAALFPNDFRDTVPDHVVALAATAVSVLQLIQPLYQHSFPIYSIYLDLSLSRRVSEWLTGVA